MNTDPSESPQRNDGLFVHIASEATRTSVAFWFDNAKQAAKFRDELSSVCLKNRVRGVIVGSYSRETAADIHAQFGSTPGLRDAEDIIMRAAEALR